MEESAPAIIKSRSKLSLLIIIVFILLIFISIVLIGILKSGKGSFSIMEKKSFSENYPEVFGRQELIVVPGDITKGGLGSVLLPSAIINSKPLFDDKEQLWKLEASFVNSNKNKVAVNLILGKNDDEILVLSAPSGQVSRTQTWNAKTVAEINQFLKKGDPLGVRIFYQESVEAYKQRENCDSVCQSRLEEKNKYYSNNRKLYETLKSGRNDLEKLDIGPVYSLIVYE
ncbi:MAG: hypothetical protein US53_C0037G0002 [Candidatus Woesebacteria bacterium GW2011_GWA1_37_7]|uniref:Uncharacterized protein n=1 Tax=Candidatus Woesebacteria bacterium GW2011_GWA1_37_7 TaxID=1618545 RepID=A0A0G0JJ80_9BACT|nr:MAG: hypothetical protein US53_C0037G0002 [Candidatus Woesebacteria bacterium GW2011_GWA1_37_7]